MLLCSGVSQAAENGIKFRYEGSALYWAYEGQEKKPENFLKFQLNKMMPPEINEQSIVAIKQKPHSLLVATKDYIWEIMDIDMPSTEWYVLRLK